MITLRTADVMSAQELVLNQPRTASVYWNGWRERRNDRCSDGSGDVHGTRVADAERVGSSDDRTKLGNARPPDQIDGDPREIGYRASCGIGRLAGHDHLMAVLDERSEHGGPPFRCQRSGWSRGTWMQHQVPLGQYRCDPMGEWPTTDA